MIIIGAGQAGLLASRRLANYHPVIMEKQSSLPNYHSALLRFRTDVIGQALGIPFKKVNVYKGVLRDDGKTITNIPTIRDINAYSLKSTGQCSERSIINTENATRYIAPGDFITNIAYNANIKYNCDCESFITERNATISERGAPIISTIPMPELMRILNYPHHVQFKINPIWTINCELLDVDVYQTLYIPYDIDQPYRVSITGNRLTLEFAFKPDPDFNYIEHYCNILFGYNFVQRLSYQPPKCQPYGKIVPIDNYERQKFILWATDNFNIYSLGRYATWRQILLDDVYKDIDVIQRFIEQRNDYNRRLYAH